MIEIAGYTLLMKDILEFGNHFGYPKLQALDRGANKWRNMIPINIVKC